MELPGNCREGQGSMYRVIPNLEGIDFWHDGEKPPTNFSLASTKKLDTIVKNSDFCALIL